MRGFGGRSWPSVWGGGGFGLGVFVGIVWVLGFWEFEPVFLLYVRRGIRTDSIALNPLTLMGVLFLLVPIRKEQGLALEEQEELNQYRKPLKASIPEPRSPKAC